MGVTVVLTPSTDKPFCPFYRAKPGPLGLVLRKPRGGCLSNQDKHDNRRLAKLRIRVEHVICWLKRFRILKERYRNRRKRFGLRARLIAGLHNFELASR